MTAQHRPPSRPAVVADPGAAASAEEGDERPRAFAKAGLPLGELLGALGDSLRIWDALSSSSSVRSG